MGRRTRRSTSLYTCPEWIFGLMAPDSPAECAEEIWWQYSQGGSATFAGDISFYAGEWDARDRVGRTRYRQDARLHMLTGEYDYSCTAEMSAGDGSQDSPGRALPEWTGSGHFPFAENPARFAEYLLPILAECQAAGAVANRPCSPHVMIGKNHRRRAATHDDRQRAEPEARRARRAARHPFGVSPADTVAELSGKLTAAQRWRDAGSWTSAAA